MSGLLLLTSLYSKAQIQAFKYKADVQKIDSAGVYRIELSPDLIAKSREDQRDIRLIDNTGKNVAYILSSKLWLSSPDRFIIFPEMNSGDHTDTSVVYVIANKNILNINKLWLTLKRTEVSRYVNISGSDDLKKWFAIKEDIPLQEADTGNGPEYQQYLTFPTSNYQYFKIQVSGKNKTPVKILQAGIYTASLNVPAYEAIPPANFTKKDSAGKTSLFISFAQAYEVKKLHVQVDGPKYFKRRIKVSVVDRDGLDQIADTVISSAGTGDIILSAKSKKFQVDVYNGDDSPVNIRTLMAYQLKEFAVAYLEAGHTYSLLTGDNSAKPVSYDLSFLNNRAYNQLPGIMHSAVYANLAFVIPRRSESVDHTALLWISIIVVLIILCLLTFRMVKELKKA